jgi:hypothetical protein
MMMIFARVIYVLDVVRLIVQVIVTNFYVGGFLDKLDYFLNNIQNSFPYMFFKSGYYWMFSHNPEFFSLYVFEFFG